MPAHSMRAASLREDYLNQVQRDFLSRRLLQGTNTPSGWPHTLRPGVSLCEGLSPQSNTGDSTPSTLCSLGLVVVY